MTEALRLTALSHISPGRRLRRFATFDAWRRTLDHIRRVVREVVTNLPRDFARAARRGAIAQLRIEAGCRPYTEATAIAMYVHYSATGNISEMVRRQITLLGQLGFSVVFVSMAEHIPEDDWQAVRQLAALVVQRPNFGLDFGAWQDLIPEVRRRWPVPRELLLVNDSVLGPIHPLAPAVEKMRAGGAGLFGLTESLQNRPHLQSYMLLARGVPAVTDLMYFLQRLYVGHSKWLLVQMGEVRLSRWMRRRGHHVAALFGYDRLIEATVANPEERRRLRCFYKRLRNLEQMSDEAAIKALHRWPLNPTHHLWRVLVTTFNYPFLKTELIRRNPERLPDVSEWQTVVPANSPCPLQVLKDHLATLEEGDMAHHCAVAQAFGSA